MLPLRRDGFVFIQRALSRIPLKNLEGCWLGLSASGRHEAHLPSLSFSYFCTSCKESSCPPRSTWISASGYSAPYDLGATGFDAAEVDDLFSKVHDKDVKDDDCELEPDEVQPFVQPGDVWTLGRHRMVCGDSTNADDVALLMDGVKANLIVTDPPYNVAYESADGKSIQNDSMADEKFFEFLLSAFRNMAAHLAEGGSAYIFHADTEGLNFRRAFKEAGFHISGVCIWVKNSLVLGRSPYQWQHEPVLYGWLPNGKHRWFSDRKQSTIWNFDKPKRSKEHPTMKPIPLLAYPIKNSSAPNGVVMDLFGGSGSTLMACEQTDRICRTMELDPRYASVIVLR